MLFDMIYAFYDDDILHDAFLQRYKNLLYYYAAKMIYYWYVPILYYYTYMLFIFLFMIRGFSWYIIIFAFHWYFIIFTLLWYASFRFFFIKSMRHIRRDILCIRHYYFTPYRASPSRATTLLYIYIYGARRARASSPRRHARCASPPARYYIWERYKRW